MPTFTFTRKTVVFDIPDESHSLHAATDAGGIRSALKSCDVALKVLDDIERNLQSLRNLLRFRRDVLSQTWSSLLRVQGFRPFDALPDEMVVEVFKQVLAFPAKKSDDGEPPFSRLMLSRVCRRWKDILESESCISEPERCDIDLRRELMESGYVLIDLRDKRNLILGYCPGTRLMRAILVQR